MTCMIRIYAGTTLYNWTADLTSVKFEPRSVDPNWKFVGTVASATELRNVKVVIKLTG